MTARWPSGWWALPACALSVFGVLASSAVADTYALAPDTKIVGQLQEYLVQQGDNLADIARKFDVGYTEMLAANPRVEPWLPRPGTKLVIPSVYILPNTPHEGIVMNLGERRLFYYPRGGAEVQTFPIGIGATGFDTPHSVTRVVTKVPNPTWYPTASSRDEQPDIPTAVPPGPDNPLGAYELRLGWKNYLIHGTNKPDGVGRNVSHGCIHLYPEDIEKLYNETALGTPVRVVEQSATAAWSGDALYLEAHPDKAQADEIDVEQPMTPRQPEGLRQVVTAAVGDAATAVDWRAADQAGMQRSGLPVVVAARGAAAPVAGVARPSTGASNAPVSLWPGTSSSSMAAGPPAAPAVASGPTPVFNYLKPPPEMAQGPRDVAGIVSQPLNNDEDEGALRSVLRDASSAAAPPPRDAPGRYDDPNAAYNAQFTMPGK
ncbi:MAG TPA: L,D-transpeptidase family protein [Stellaceae bacterium]|nr:L,D-transpeptidase family protein [Stellaceae bacterium]